MADTCTVSGTLLAPDGSPLVNATVVFERSPKRVYPASPDTIAPHTVRTQTNGSGAVSVDLVPAEYKVSTQGSSYPAFSIVVPDESTANLADIQDAMPEPYITQAQAIVAQAESARDDAQALYGDLSAVNQAKIDAQNAASSAEALYGDLDAVNQAVTAAEGYADSCELWRDQAVTAAATAVQAAGEVQQETLLTAGMAEALGQIGVIGRSVETLRKRALAQGEVTIDNADAGGWLIPAGNTVAVTLPYELIDTDYAVAAEIILAEPGVAHAGQVVVTERAVNGFTLRVTGAARNIVVRWTLLNPRQLYQ